VAVSAIGHPDSPRCPVAARREFVNPHERRAQVVRDGVGDLRYAPRIKPKSTSRPKSGAIYLQLSEEVLRARYA
jgi:hypothetical protein